MYSIHRLRLPCWAPARRRRKSSTTRPWRWWAQGKARSPGR